MTSALHRLNVHQWCFSSPCICVSFVQLTLLIVISTIQECALNKSSVKNKGLKAPRSQKTGRKNAERGSKRANEISCCTRKITSIFIIDITPSYNSQYYNYFPHRSCLPILSPYSRCVYNLKKCKKSCKRSLGDETESCFMEILSGIKER